METNGFGSGSSQNWIPSCLSVYVSWKRAIAIESRIGQKMLKGFFLVVACATVRYSTDVICFEIAVVMPCVYCALWRCVYSLLDVTFRL